MQSAVLGAPCALEKTILTAITQDFIDRDLKQTGQGIVAISGGSGHYEVCAKMMQMTKQKIIDHGIGCDLICLSKPPLHMVIPINHLCYCCRRDYTYTHSLALCSKARLSSDVCE
jgi:hypothetical protein